MVKTRRIVRGIWVENSHNLKKKGIKLKFSGKLYFYYRNNILKFPIGSKGGTPLILPLKSRDLTQTIKI